MSGIILLKSSTVHIFLREKETVKTAPCRRRLLPGGIWSNCLNRRELAQIEALPDKRHIDVITDYHPHDDLYVYDDEDEEDQDVR